MKRSSNVFKNVLIVIGLGMLSVSCLEQIDLEIPKGFEDTIVVQGSLVMGDPSIVRVEVSRLFDFTTESLTERTNVRVVNLIDEQGNSIELEEINLGRYGLSIPKGSTFEVAAGKSYKIALSTFDGRSFESSLEALLPVPEIQSLTPSALEKSFIINDTEVEVDSFVQFRLNTPLQANNANEKSYLRWKYFRTFKVTDSPLSISVLSQSKTCYVTEQLDQGGVSIFNGNDLEQGNLEDLLIYETIPNGVFAEGYYLQVIQESLTQSAFEYWDQVSQVIDRDGNIFQSPAGKIKTNFANVNDPSEEVHGYFYATMHDTIRVFVDTLTANNPDQLCPPQVPPPPSGCPVLICCDCLSVGGSTLDIPHFWDQ